MNVTLSQSMSWRKHVEDRFAAAVELRLISQTVALQMESGIVFVPDDYKPDARVPLEPDAPLRSFGSEPIPTSAEWVLRKDLFDDAASWMKQHVANLGGPWLYCDSGWSELGDASLSRQPHIELYGRPISYVGLQHAEVEAIARLLRLCRSSRIVGVVGAELVASETHRPLETGSFVADGLRGDSLVLVNFCLSPV